ncbi:MAG: hypothetical protein JXA57_16890 [Armatimonadetes bacterium]|nr:hypothetical protein [Armatimonadota bacterium]
MAASREEIGRIVLLLREGRSSAEVAEIVGVSSPTVWAVKANMTQGKYDPDTDTRSHRRPILHFGRDRRFGVTGKPWELRDEHRDQYCAMLAALRRGEEQAVRFFFSLLDPELSTNVVIALVPCHLPGMQSLGLGGLGRALAAHGRTDATSRLVRLEPVPTLAEVPERGLGLQRTSIAVGGSPTIRDRAVLLLDDLAFTGHSLRACEEALFQAGAADVQCVVLGRAEPAFVLAKASAKVPPLPPGLLTAGALKMAAAPPAPWSRLAPQPQVVSDHEPGVEHKVPPPPSLTPGPKPRPECRHELDSGTRPKGEGPDYGRMRQTTRPLIVDGAPGPSYWKMLKEFGAIGNVE